MTDNLVKIPVFITGYQSEQLKRLAMESGESRSHIVRAAIWEYLAQRIPQTTSTALKERTDHEH